MLGWCNHGRNFVVKCGGAV